jgi:hypothetical protein
VPVMASVSTLVSSRVMGSSRSGAGLAT